jgi:hypothetical protein
MLAIQQATRTRLGCAVDARTAAKHAGCVARFGLFVVLALLSMTARVSAADLPAVDQLAVPAGEAPTQCRSYGRTRTGQATAQAAYTHERLGLSALLFGRGEQAAAALFDQYLQHGTVSPVRRDVDDQQAAGEFATDPQTVTAYRHLRRDLDAAATHFRPTNAIKPVTGTFRSEATQRTSSFVMQTSDASVHGTASYMAIDYTPTNSGTISSILRASTTPALIAGGTGSAITQRGTFLDTRTITGDWTLKPSSHQSGPLTDRALALSHVRLAISDSIDFCPGGLGSARQLLLPLSRLERTPFGGGGWVHPVLWKTLVALPDATENVTERPIARHAATPAPTGLLQAISDFVSRLASAAHQLLSGSDQASTTSQS